MPNSDTVINAEPIKEFFIDMLTRDIGLFECILDLVDNSIHGLIRTHRVDVMPAITGGTRKRIPPHAKIEIDVNPKKFRLLDTCGGIKRDTARSEIFRFGRSSPEVGLPGLGLYGVGMKRSFFKLGRHVRMISRCGNDIFSVTIDVDGWKKDKNNWTFQFDDDPPLSTLRTSGTLIEVTKLNEGAGQDLSSESAKKDLRTLLGDIYMLFINNGLRIILNGQAATSSFPEIETKRFKPARKNLRVDGVDICIIAGLAPKDFRTPHGWYVFCNGRMVLKADQTRVTGWGVDRYPQFHTKYNHFIGHVYFSTTELDKLPWDTTKSRLVEGTRVYKAALQEMKIQARPILDTLNKFYPSESEEEEVIQRELLQETKPVKIDKLAKRESGFKVKPGKRHTLNVNILYKKPHAVVERVKRAIGNRRMSPRKVGEYTFEYFVNKECD